MNSDFMLKVADAIEKEQKFHFLDKDGWKVTLSTSFDMESWGTMVNMEPHTHTQALDCGTSACVAGWACILDSPEGWYRRLTGYDSFSTERRARVLLGLSDADAHRLFYASPVGMVWLNDNAKYVPDALRWMALNGEVDWVRALEAAGAPDVPEDEYNELEDLEDYEDDAL